VLYEADSDRVIGIRTGDKGIDKDGNKRPNFEPGVDSDGQGYRLRGRAPGKPSARDRPEAGSIFEDKMPQVFETAIKEVIEIPESSPFNSSATTVVHSFGYPLGFHTKGGGFLYKMKDSRVSLGFVVGLEYEDPLFEPYQAFLSFKKHPLIADIIQGGKVLQQGRQDPAGRRLLYDAPAGAGRRGGCRRQRLHVEYPAAQGRAHRHEIRHAGG
jgi:electron-transferring-flavoprotein dehydrogenase